MPEKLTIDHIYANFAAARNWEEKYGYIISLGKTLSGLPEDAKTDENKVLGCLSNVWIILKKDISPTDKPVFLADSDAFIVKGLIVILLTVLQNKTATEILQFDVDAFFDSLDLRQHLSPSRTNGFYSLVKKIKQICLLSLHNSLKN